MWTIQNSSRARARGDFCIVHNGKIGMSVGLLKGPQKFQIQFFELHGGFSFVDNTELPARARARPRVGLRGMFFGRDFNVSPPGTMRSWMTAARRHIPSRVLVFGGQQPGARPRVAGARPRGRGHGPRAGRRGRERLPGARGRGESLRACMSARACDVALRPTARA